MDLKKLAGDLLGIVKAAAPIVGLGEEVAAAETLVRQIIDTVDGVKGAFDSDDQAALSDALAALRVRVGEHADKTINSLG
jgi:hypothetical protein